MGIPLMLLWTLYTPVDRLWKIADHLMDSRAEVPVDTSMSCDYTIHRTVTTVW